MSNQKSKRADQVHSKKQSFFTQANTTFISVDNQQTEKLKINDIDLEAFQRNIQSQQNVLEQNKKMIQKRLVKF